MSGNNEHGTQPRLRVALIGEGQRAATVADRVRAAAAFDVLGQAGMPQTAAAPDIPWVDDARILLSNPELQAVLLAGSTRADLEMGQLATQRGLHVWRLPPAARNFSEAHEIAKRLGRDAPIYHVASWWESAVASAWHELAWPTDFKPGYSEARLSGDAPPRESWKNHLHDAGGGVLACDAYTLLEVLVATRGLPEAAFATVRTSVRDTARTRDTEDAAVAILHYPAGGIAWIRAGWELPPAEAELTHFGVSGAARLTREELVLTTRDAQVADRRPVHAGWVTADLSRFVELVNGKARDRAAAALERHLAVAALLESLYLASQTNHPESPQKLYEVQGRPLPRT